MKCKKVRRFIPLVIGSEISERKISAVKVHLKKCPRCRQEYDSWALSLGKVKEWLKEEKIELEGQEWEEMIRKAVRKGRPKVLPLIPWAYKKAWVYALMAFLAVAITLFVINTSFFQEKGRGGEGVKQAQVQLLSNSLQESQQEVISVTLVSQETGLKIFWFFDKNFELKEEK